MPRKRGAASPRAAGYFSIASSSTSGEFSVCKGQPCPDNRCLTAGATCVSGFCVEPAGDGEEGVTPRLDLQPPTTRTAEKPVLWVAFDGQVVDLGEWPLQFAVTDDRVLQVRRQADAALHLHGVHPCRADGAVGHRARTLAQRHLD